MTDTEMLIRCPGCGTPHRVTLAVGRQLRCTTCQTVFFAPVLDRSSETPPVVADPMPQRRASWREDASVPRPGPATTSADVSPHACGLLWKLVAPASVLCIVISGSILGIYAVRRGGQTRGGSAQPGPAPVLARPDARGSTSEYRWTDALRGAQQLDALETRVVRAKYGAVRAKDLNNEVMTTDDTNLIAVTVSVHNRGAQPHAFQSWYAGTAVQKGAGELLPELADDADRVYALLRFEDVSSIEGQRLADPIEPHQRVQDTLVFLVPEDIDRTEIRYLRLALPADALGARGWFRFEIPARMIQGLVDAAPSGESARPVAGPPAAPSEAAGDAPAAASPEAPGREPGKEPGREPAP